MENRNLEWWADRERVADENYLMGQMHIFWVMDTLKALTSLPSNLCM